MDFDDDDPLDDLLRDAATSTADWKSRTANSPPAAGEVRPVAAVNAKKEKKSALLAELFGPPTSDLLDFSAPVASRSEDSLNVKLQSKFETPAVAESAATDFSLGSYVPSLGSKPASAPVTKSVFPSDIFTTKNDSATDSLPTSQKVVSPSKSTPAKSIFPSDIFSSHSEATNDPTPLKVEESLNSPIHVGGKSIFPSDVFSSQSRTHSDPPPPRVDEPTHRSSSQHGESIHTEQVPKRLVETTNLEAVLNRFAERLCEELRGLSRKEEGLQSISTGLNRLAEIQSSQPQRTESDLGQRLSKLEAAVDLLTSRMQSLGGCVSGQEEAASRMKLDLETRLGKQLETVQTWCNRLETNFTEKLQIQRTEFESKQQELKIPGAHSANKGAINSEMAQILKGELKWLERQKSKLQQQRESNEKLHGIIEERFRQLSRLSEELQGAAGMLQCQQRLLQESLQKLDQKVLKLNLKREQHSNKTDPTTDDPDQLKEVGVALWKMHVRNDESAVAKQHQFLTQLLNKQN